GSQRIMHPQQPILTNPYGITYRVPHASEGANTVTKTRASASLTKKELTAEHKAAISSSIRQRLAQGQTWGRPRITPETENEIAVLLKHKTLIDLGIARIAALVGQGTSVAQRIAKDKPEIRDEEAVLRKYMGRFPAKAHLDGLWFEFPGLRGDIEATK